MVLRSSGITSRGRVGINAALTAEPIVNPWFVDPIDKTVLIQGLNDIVANIKSGAFLNATSCAALIALISVPNLNMITPDNTTTITDYGKLLREFLVI